MELDNSSHKTAARWISWLPLAAAAAVLIWHSLRYNFVTDDAYISFVFSRNLAEHGQLTFNLGDPVEGYTNFLWTFVLGVLLWLGIPPEISSLVLGTACAVATLLVSYRLMSRVIGAGPWRTVPALLLACSSGFACWSSGGLETQLFTLLVVLAIDAYVASYEDGEGSAFAGCGVLLALAAMTRPEGLLITALVALHRVATNLVTERRLLPSRHEWNAALGFLLVWAPWFAWRYWYYGYPFPNTYYVKAHGRWSSPKLASDMWSAGWHYLEVWVAQAKLVWAAPLAALGIASSVVSSPQVRPRRVLVTLLLLIGGVYALYAASVGGDFMGLHRFIMPLFVFVAILVALGGAWMFDEKLRESMPRSVSVGAAALLVTGFAISQWRLTQVSLRWGNFGNDRGIDTPAFLIAYTQDRAAIGKAMKDCLVPEDFSIVGGAGAQPYHARMRGIDVFGLVSRRIAHEEPRTNARAGHTKWGSDKLLVEHNPTFVFSCYLIHGTAEAPHLPCAGPWLGRGFEQVTMHVPAMRERGTYYTFLARKDRNFTCPGRVH
jgi:hypothetical protein